MSTLNFNVLPYLQDLSVWKDKHQLLDDTVSFLIATCDDQVSQELRERYLTINTRWQALFPVMMPKS